jgi:phospholipid/cholesterol/gamma-HCH transport system substrate-binding protein
MSVRAQLIKLIVFTLVALAVLWLLWSTLLNSTSGDTRSYTAEFTDVSGLHQGDSVRMAGVRVGRVDSMRLAGTHAEVTMSVAADQPVFQNTRAVIRYQNLVGQRYIALAPGEGPATPLPDGGDIPLQRTQPSLDLSALLNGFQPLYSVIKPTEVNQLSENLLQVLQGTAPDVAPLLDQTAQLTNTIGDRDQIIGAVIDNLNPVLTQLAGKGPEFDDLLDQSYRLVNGLNGQTNSIFGSLERLQRFTGNAQDLLSDIRPDVHDDMRGAADVADVFNHAKPQLRDTLAGFPGFLAGLARVTDYGSWANLYLCEGSLLLPGGVSINSAITPNEPHTAVCR